MLSGGEGNDTFIYRSNEGTDLITDFAAGDMLQILNADGSQGSFNSSIFSGNTLILIIDGGGSVLFTGISSANTFNINGIVHKISGSKLK